MYLRLLSLLAFCTVAICQNAFLTFPLADASQPLYHGWFYDIQKDYHGAIDVIRPQGTPVLAAADGRAIASCQPPFTPPPAGQVGWFGYFVLIDHLNGYSTLYAHLSAIDLPSTSQVPCDGRHSITSSSGPVIYNQQSYVWTPVKRGDKIGEVGQTGASYAHLHFEVSIDGTGNYNTHAAPYATRVDSYNLQQVASFYPPPTALCAGIDMSAYLWTQCPPSSIVTQPPGSLSWSVSVSFDDGGMGTGFFVYDANSTQMLNWGISVSGGNTSSFPPFTYTPANTFAAIGSGNAPMPEKYWTFSTGTGAFGDRQFRLVFLSPLTDVGGTVGLDLSKPGLHTECFNCFPIRNIVSGSASANAVTFDQPVTFQQPLGFPGIYKSATTQGYTFTGALGQYNGLTVRNICNGDNVCDGSAALDSYGAFPSIIMAKTAGGTFTLREFDAAPPYLTTSPNAFYVNPTSINVLGTLANSTTLTTTFNLVNNAFQTFTLPANWTNLVSVTFTGSGPSCYSTGCFEFLLDNIGAQ